MQSFHLRTLSATAIVVKQNKTDLIAKCIKKSKMERVNEYKERFVKEASCVINLLLDVITSLICKLVFTSRSSKHNNFVYYIIMTIIIIIYLLCIKKVVIIIVSIWATFALTKLYFEQLFVIWSFLILSLIFIIIFRSNVKHHSQSRSFRSERFFTPCTQ